MDTLEGKEKALEMNENNKIFVLLSNMRPDKAFVFYSHVKNVKVKS